MEHSNEVTRFGNIIEQSNYVKSYLTEITKGSLFLCENVNWEIDTYDEVENLSFGKVNMEVAINRNSVDVMYRTNGITVEFKIGDTWIEINKENFFEMLSTYMVLNIIDMCNLD